MCTDVTLREIRAFLAVADERHFTRAGDRLGITHARVSQLIGVLEVRIGGRLLERTSRRVDLSPLGAGLATRLAPAYAELLAALQVSEPSPDAGPPQVELAELRVFLSLCEELHFGRTADRMRLTQSRVSQIIRGLEGQLGGRLFDRTSRTVALTARGGQLRRALAPVDADLHRALEDAHLLANDATAGGTDGVLRLGFVLTFPSGILAELVATFHARHPEVRVKVAEYLTAPDDWDVWGPLRRRETDILVYWGGPAAAPEPDLVVGPVLEESDRVLLVSRHHRLARRSAVSVEELAVESVMTPPPTLPASAMETQIPSLTPGGRPIPRAESPRSYRELLALVARGRIVHPTATGNPLVHRDDIVAVPLYGLPPLQLAPIWRAADTNDHIRAFVHAAQHDRRPPPAPVA
jgi:DNA-binding transcriptional LysR family regulator